MNISENAKLAVTGASGFIGRGLIETLAQQNIPARGISRGKLPDWAGATTQWHSVASYEDTAALSSALGGAQFLLHLADNPSRTAARDANTAAAIARVVKAAAESASVEGIIFASSVYAAKTDAPYGQGKRDAEEVFLSDSKIPTVILRLPPVYGKGGRGGLSTLAALAKKGLPLPFGLASEPRNYLSRRNFCDLIQHMIDADAAAWQRADGKIFEPSDGRAISTRALVDEMGRAQGRPVRQVPVPTGLLRLAGKLSGRSALVSGAIDRLDVVPNTELTEFFGWTPAEQMPESLHFLKV
ncbi:NAD-dependent epimerase/dehydratase family protein [Neorhizobium sp. NPDC001467]|uniref:NAD-dependent epimerase/dehydratase family protein n=1 Tax=Neorhizobium sp. NPDC001467 TaxID=3390595 RepID=UPI003D045A40